MGVDDAADVAGNELINSRAESNQMRIARLATVPYFMVSQLAIQISLLEKSGATITVITSNGSTLDDLRPEQLFSRFIPVEISRQISLVSDLKALWKLFLIFRQEGFEIVHSTTPKAGLLSSIAAMLAGVPVRLHTFTGQQWLHLRGPKRWVSRWADWVIGGLNTRCFADSESQRNFLVGQRIISGRKLSVIGAGSLAGVDLDRFDPARFPIQEKTALRQTLGIPNEVPVLLFVGRITTDKGVRELIAAFRELKTRGSPAHLVLAGPLDPEGRAEHGISPEDIHNVADTHFVGYVKCPEAYMAIADILCLPSYREGFGTVVIEAAAMGIPTVGTNIYGLSDAVVDGQTGILVPPRNSKALAEALARIMRTEDKRLDMGKAARVRVEQYFDARVVTKNLLQEYSRLLSQ